MGGASPSPTRVPNLLRFRDLLEPLQKPFSVIPLRTIAMLMRTGIARGNVRMSVAHNLVGKISMIYCGLYEVFLDSLVMILSY